MSKKTDKTTATVKNSKPPLLVGYAFDVHNVVRGRGIVLGGTSLALPLKVVAHSDGDVVLHALANAILGAIGQYDIGFYFSDRDSRAKGMSSSRILRFCLQQAVKQGYALSNLDLQVVSQDVMVSVFREEMVASITKLTGCRHVSIKGTRWEKRSGQLACHAIVALSLAT